MLFPGKWKILRVTRNNIKIYENQDSIWKFYKIHRYSEYTQTNDDKIIIIIAYNFNF